MAVLVDIVVLLILAAPVAVVAAAFVSFGPGMLAATFRPAAPLAWPRGVQEEDGVSWRWAVYDDGASIRDEGSVAATRPVQGRVTNAVGRVRR